MAWEVGTKDFNMAKMRKARWASPTVKHVEAMLRLVYFVVAVM
jgi:hypothetical protein